MIATFWTTTGRLVRAEVMKIESMDYIRSARAIGLPDMLILVRHVLPNTTHILLVQATIAFVAAIKTEVILSFLGLGVQPPMSSWGVLINEGAKKLDIYPWQLIFPAIFFSLTLFSLNFIGDGLRDALDPRLKL